MNCPLCTLSGASVSVTTEIQLVYLLRLGVFFPNIRSLMERGFRGGFGGLRGDTTEGGGFGGFSEACLGGFSFGFSFGFLLISSSFSFDFAFWSGRSFSFDFTFLLLLKTGRHHILPCFGPEEPEDVLTRAVRV